MAAVREMRLRGISSIEEAQAFTPAFIAVEPKVRRAAARHPRRSSSLDQERRCARGGAGAARGARPVQSPDVQRRRRRPLRQDQRPRHRLGRGQDNPAALARWLHAAALQGPRPAIHKGQILAPAKSRRRRRNHRRSPRRRPGRTPRRQSNRRARKGVDNGRASYGAVESARRPPVTHPPLNQSAEGDIPIVRNQGTFLLCVDTCAAAFVRGGERTRRRRLRPSSILGKDWPTSCINPRVNRSRLTHAMNCAARVPVGRRDSPEARSTSGAVGKQRISEAFLV